MADQSVENLEIVWRSVAELCSGLDDAQWQLPTSCPGWTVQDQLSHLSGTESMLVGVGPRPEALTEVPAHVRNDIGAGNEAVVDLRRAWPPAQVLAEFEEITSTRLEQLHAMSDEDLAQDSWTPIGPGTVRDLLAVRAFDCWVHEQDIREAVGKPGHLDGPVAANALARCLLAMPYVRRPRRHRSYAGLPRHRGVGGAGPAHRDRPGGADGSHRDGLQDLHPPRLRSHRSRSGARVRCGHDHRRPGAG
jgi:uncharacterized protein (TIGR03083 family)